MTARLCLAICSGFAPELKAAVAQAGWPDVDVLTLPTRCGRPPLRWDELRERLPADCSEVQWFGRGCLDGLGAAPAGVPPVTMHRLENCFHLVAPRALVDEAVAAGAYLMTPTWLLRWRERLADLGFTGPLAVEFLADTVTEMQLLDTGTEPGAAAALQGMAQDLPMPVRRVAVGLDSTLARLAPGVQSWREARAHAALRDARQRHASELADHVAAMDMLARLVQLPREDAVVAGLVELLQTLFGPREVHHVGLDRGVERAAPGTPPDVRLALQSMQAAHALTDDGAGFLLRVGPADDPVGKVAVLGLAVPQQRARYLGLALSLMAVCGVVIQNARLRERLALAEKLASLDLVVAGVAHEINTPLGVNLVAMSTLQEQLKTLQQQFTERRMTQTDLTRFLALGQEETVLMQRNLQRIGELVARFRQVATGGPAPAPVEFVMRTCITEVLDSLAERLQRAGVQTSLRCDPELRVHGQVADWVGVFTNLVVNTLQHGLRGRSGGHIQIEVEADAHRLRVDYGDDGVGMDEATRVRVFDPFFTTGMQQGMGLGMHLVFNLVTHRFGGRIECDSAPGAGARFHIEVPR